MFSSECHRAPLVDSRHWFTWWFIDVRPELIQTVLTPYMSSLTTMRWMASFLYYQKHEQNNKTAFGIFYDICCSENDQHYSDVIMSAMASQITGVSIVCSTVSTGVDERKHQSSAGGLCEGNNEWLVDSPHKGPVTRKMFPFDDVVMKNTPTENDKTVPTLNTFLLNN